MRWIAAQLGLGSCLFSGVLFALAYPPFEIPILGWVGLMPLVWALYAKCVRWWHLWAGGVLSWALQLWWVGYVTWLGAALLWMYLGLYWLVWGRWMAIVFRFFPKRTSATNLACAALGATGWSALEELRGWLLSGFPWNNLAVSQYKNMVFIQIASVGGVELLGWVMMMVQLVFALTVLRLMDEVRSHRHLRPHWEFTTALALLGGVTLHGMMCVVPVNSKQGTASLRIGLVQGNVPQHEKFSPLSLEQTVAAFTVPTAALASAQPDVILWPETATGVGIFQDAYVRSEVTSLVEEIGVPILAGSVEVDEQGRLYNSALLLVPGLQEDAIRAAAYKKQHLVPFGEFLPGRKWFPWLWRALDMPEDFHPGPRSGGLLLIVGQRTSALAGVLICFEDILPSLARFRAQSGAQLLVNLTNDGWFCDSPAAYAHMTNALFRAVENRLPLVRATNTGVSCVVSPLGAVTNLLLDEQGRHTAVAGAMVVEVPIGVPSRTLYQQFGHLFGDVCAAVVASVWLVSVLQRYWHNQNFSSYARRMRETSARGMTRLRNSSGESC